MMSGGVHRSGRGRYAARMLAATCLGMAVVLSLFGIGAALAAEPWRGFSVAALLAAAIAIPLLMHGRAGHEPTRREALATVIVTWLLVPVVGALPFTLDGPLGPLEALFESASGFTTTGATMLTDFSVVSESLFLWRALTQWIGGIGIIVLFIAAFPQLAVAGRQLFSAEAPGPESERFVPRLRHTAIAILGLYGGLTVAAGVTYRAAGMSGFDAVAHALTTLSAGGFSPAARSFEDYPALLSWVALPFMALAGANFALMYRAVAGRSLALWRDPEFRTYLSVLTLGSLALSALLVGHHGWLDGLRHGAFQTLSLTTSTGYASADFAGWSRAAQALLVIMMLIGGSAGSAAGGVKIVRWLILARLAMREVRHTLQPRAVLPIRLGARIVPDTVVRSVAAFVTLYMALLAASVALLVMLGADALTAFTASLATLGNIGPGLALVGPMASYAEFPPLAQGWLTIVMIAGRLEVVTVFVVFTRAWWRRPTRHAPR